MGQICGKVDNPDEFEPAYVPNPTRDARPYPGVGAKSGGRGGDGGGEWSRLTFDALYERGRKKLGSGNYADVYCCSPRHSPARPVPVYAVKCILKSKLTKEDMDALAVEVEAMERLKDHPNFVRIIDHFNEKDYYYIVLELIEGGELFERIQKKDHYSERDARLIMQQLASAMAVAHMRNICHRDLKPENILLASKTDDTSLKVADLGFAKVLKGKNQLLSTPCGTPGYVAPEVIAGNPSYTVACDVWSLGVILFILLCGYPPFMAEDQAQLFNDIKAGRFEMDPTYWRGISLPAQDLVRRLLVVNPAKRLTAEQILSHPWVLNASAVPNTHLSSAMEGVRKLVARRRLRKAIAAVRLTVRMKLRMAALNSLDARRRGADPQAAFFAGARQVPSRPASSDDSEYPAALLEAGRARRRALPDFGLSPAA